MMTLKLAFRGLWRHKIRTLITVGAIFTSHCWGLVFLSMNDGGHELMIEMGIRQGRAGHVVVQAKDYQQTQAVELLVTDPEKIRKIIRQKVPKSRVVLRAFGGGLARSANDAVGVMFAGVEPDQEKHVDDLAKKIVRGVYLGAEEADIRKAEAKEAKRKGDGPKLGPKGLWCARKAGPDEPPRRPVVIGVRMAKTLRVGLCEKLVLDVQGMGNKEQAEMRVVGIFKTGTADLDAFTLQAPLKVVQRLMHIGTGVHQVAIFVGSMKRTEATVKAIRGPIEDGSLVVLPWDKAMPEMAEFIWLDEASGYIFMFILYLIVMIGVLNTVLMSVMERTKEFGVMRALGAGPLRIVGLVLAEGLMLGILGVIIGSALAAYPLYYLETTGIDIAMFTGGEAMEAGGVVMTVMKGKLYLSSTLWACFIIVDMTVAAAIYPAIRAAKVKVLKAIHQA
jgi:ABC-type lipoprotein release transport system permease subunit